MQVCRGFRAERGRALAASTTAAVVAAAAFVWKGCDRREASVPSPAPSASRNAAGAASDPWAAERWVEKAVRVFGDGRVVSPNEARDLARRPKEEVLGRLLAHEAAARSMFRLFLSTQGKVVDTVMLGPEVHPDLLASHPAAAHAAVAFAQGGDVEVLFDFAQPLVVAGWAEPLRTPEEAGLTAHEVRKRGLADVRSKARALRKALLADRDSGSTETASCERRREESRTSYLGLLEAFRRVRFTHSNALLDSWFPSLFLCAFADAADPVPPTWRQVEDGFARAERGLDALEAFSRAAPAASPDLARATTLEAAALGVDASNAGAISRPGFYIDNP